MDRELEINGNTVSMGEEKRYKYLLNGKTYYYTKDELREYLRDLYEKNNFSLSDECLTSYVESEIERLEKYDGDPFGNLKNFPKAHEIAHKATAMGVISMIH